MAERLGNWASILKVAGSILQLAKVAPGSSQSFLSAVALPKQVCLEPILEGGERVSKTQKCNCCNPCYLQI